jgi:NhaP-type Na+/H+ or K+/H+ antiporter
MRRLVIESAGHVSKDRDSMAILISLLGGIFFAVLIAQGLDAGAGLLAAAAFWTAIATVFADADDPQARRRRRRERFPQYLGRR